MEFRYRFGGDGFVQFGGSLSESFGNLISIGDRLYLTGASQSSNAGVDGPGYVNSTGYGGFVIGFDANTGRSLPRITSPTSLAVALGTPVDHTVTATNAPYTLSASYVPSGLQFDASTGVLSGTPASAGTFYISFKCSNEFGSNTLNFVSLCYPRRDRH